jgi:23S rRNA (adenine2503-C2)-methyltransferase
MEMKRPQPPRSFLDLTLLEAEGLFADMGQPKYRASQVLSWIFKKHVVRWEDMSNLPAPLREQLAGEWNILTSRVETIQKSADGTTKLLVKLFDGRAVECVCIPEEKANTVCLSTQVGCPIGCFFCASGKGGLLRNLSAGEILEQILHIFSAIPSGQTIRNVVLMGMGEPMRNYGNVLRAVRSMNAPWGFEIGARRITLSTVGDVKGIERLSEENLQVNLAISLHAADDATRAKIVPGKKMPPVSSVVEAARDYFAKTRRKVTFEYVLIDGVNSSVLEARKLARLLRGFPCFVNLIPLNPVEGPPWNPPDKKTTRGFLWQLEQSGIPAAIRASRGGDIAAACGQLAGEKRGRSPVFSRSASEKNRN